MTHIGEVVQVVRVEPLAVTAEDESRAPVVEPSVATTAGEAVATRG